MSSSPTDFNARIIEELTIEVGNDRIDAVSSEATGDERDRLFSAQAERSPQFAAYQENTERAIPVMILTPKPGRP